jgi:hypothetical protein
MGTYLRNLYRSTCDFCGGIEDHWDRKSPEGWRWETEKCCEDCQIPVLKCRKCVSNDTPTP